MITNKDPDKDFEELKETVKGRGKDKRIVWANLMRNAINTACHCSCLEISYFLRMAQLCGNEYSIAVDEMMKPDKDSP